jgi:hypothetical protein
LASLATIAIIARCRHRDRAELKDHPHNGWSLLGLKLALEGMGKASSDVTSDLSSSWSRANTWIQASRF